MFECSMWYWNESAIRTMLRCQLRMGVAIFIALNVSQRFLQINKEKQSSDVTIAVFLPSRTSWSWYGCFDLRFHCQKWDFSQNNWFRAVHLLVIFQIPLFVYQDISERGSKLENFSAAHAIIILSTVLLLMLIQELQEFPRCSLALWWGNARLQSYDITAHPGWGSCHFNGNTTHVIKLHSPGRQCVKLKPSAWWWLESLFNDRTTFLTFL